MTLLDFIATVALTAIVVVNVNALVTAMPLDRIGRLALTVVIGAWIGLQVALTASGAYASGGPTIGISVVLPIVAVAAGMYWWPRFRHALMAAPTALLVGLNTSRVFGIFFLVLVADGRLGGPFPQSAGWGDIITGAIALPLALALARGRAAPQSVLAWNAFGALDLIAALALGVLSAPGSPIQVISAGVGSAAITTLPWALIPTVLVPFYLVLHGVIFLQYRQASKAGRPQANFAT